MKRQLIAAFLLTVCATLTSCASQRKAIMIDQAIKEALSQYGDLEPIKGGGGRCYVMTLKDTSESSEDCCNPTDTP